MNFKALLLIFCSWILVACTETNPWQEGRWIDLTHEFSEESIYWPTADPFQMDTLFAGQTEAGFYYEAYRFSTAEHGGTHLDAPIHFSEGQQAVHELEIEQTVGPAVVIDVSDKASENRDYQIKIDDIEEWERNFGLVPENSIILFRTGFGNYWPDAERYLGTAKRGEEALTELSFPGIHPDAAQWLVDKRNPKAVGLDTPSLDYGKSEQFKTHQILFDHSVPGFENVANLDLLPPHGAYILALPMKIENGSGAPLRIVAWLS